jgi:hypothetical protein
MHCVTTFREVLTELGKLGFNIVVANFLDSVSTGRTDDLVKEAFKQGLAGNGTKHMWIFTVHSAESVSFSKLAKGSDLQKAYLGSGMIF